MRRLKIYKVFDFSLLACVLILTICGIVFIYSAGFNSERISARTEYSKQIVWAVLGFGSLIFFAVLNYNFFYRYAFHFFAASILVLVFVFFKGVAVNGSRSWFRIFGLGIQPSELTKITYTFFLAWYLERSENEPPFKRFAVSLISLFVPMSIILIQPDFGTGSVFVAIFLVMCFMANIKTIYLISFLTCGFFSILFALFPFIYDPKTVKVIKLFSETKYHLALVFVTFAVTIFSLIMYRHYKIRYWYYISLASGIICMAFILSMGAEKIFSKYDYQVKRLISFINPERSSTSASYQVVQSKNSIGSGGFFGRGFLRGTLSQANFVPEKSTDFIFSIFSEEMGFIGGISIFIVYTVMLLRIVYIIKQSTSKFATYIASGILGMFFYHFVINVGMTMGIMPVTGIPFPFFSYGGSSLIVSMIAIGILMSINYRRLDF